MAQRGDVIQRWIFIVGIIALSVKVVSVVSSERDERETINSRFKRSIKDPVPKDNDAYSNFFGVAVLRKQVTQLEKTVQDDEKERRKQAEDFQIELSKQKGQIKRLESEISEIRTNLESHGEQLGKLGGVGNGDNYFVYSNHTCGGVLVGQVGYVIYDYEEHRAQPRPSNCMWTIRVNNRASIKVSTHTIQRADMGNVLKTGNTAYVVELLTNFQNNTQAVKIKTTKLRPYSYNVFVGPVIFIVYTIGGYNNDYVNANLHIQFEGMYKETMKSTHFSHESLVLYGKSHSFSDLDLTSWQFQSEKNYSREYTTIVLSNFSTKVSLEATFNKTQCGDNSRVLLFVNSLDNNQFGKDCCKTDCSSSIIYNNPALLVISKQIDQKFQFQLKWEIDPAYPSDSHFVMPANTTEYVATPCGEVLGGYFGTIRYKPTTVYQDDERCIWMIVPQPVPKTSIQIILLSSGVETYYDNLYAMELTDVNGTMLEDAPRITRLSNLLPNETFVAHSKELYIVFSSDASITGTGFTLQYEVIGSAVTGGVSIANQFSILKETTGHTTSNFTMNKPKYKVVALSPVSEFLAYGKVLRLNLTSANISKNSTDSSCFLPPSITLFTLYQGVFRKEFQTSCNDQHQVVLTAKENMALIVINDIKGDINSPLQLTWESAFEDGKPYFRTDDDQCGGVIEAEAGIIRYKSNTRYLNFERCIWLVHVPSRSKIDFELVKSEFEECCDYLIISKLDPESGSFASDNTTLKKSEGKLAQVRGSLAVVLFQSDKSVPGKGFILKFTTSGHPVSSKYKFLAVHKNDPSGSLTSPPDDDYVEELEYNFNSQNILVFAYSPQIAMEGGGSFRHVKVGLASGMFQPINESCQHDSVTVYTYNDGWNQSQRLPHPSQDHVNLSGEEACDNTIQVSEKKVWFETHDATFIVIHKYQPRNPGLVSFTWKKESECGGVHVAESGDISYKESTIYENYERCLWLVEVPQAFQIEFTLTTENFEKCCDYVMVSSVSAQQGIPGKVFRLGGGNGTVKAIVDGPIGIVAFYSDSSVVGGGFKLSYKAKSVNTQRLRNSMILVEQQLTNPARYERQVESNQIVMMVHSATKHALHYVNEQLAHRLQVSVEAFRPQINSSCASDQLIFYNFPTPSGIQREQIFDATNIQQDIPQDVHGHCDPLDVSMQPSHCTVIQDCKDRLIGSNSVLSNSGTFIAIYKSIGGVSSRNSTVRGFSLKTAMV